MADSYVPIFFDWMEVTGELNAQEKGRLIDAIVCYARGDGDWQEQIKGNERYLFPAFKRQIDRAAELSDIRSKAGASKGKQTEANASKTEQKPAKPSKTHKEEEYKEEYKEEYEYENNNNSGGGDARARELSAAPAFDSPDFKADLTSPITYAVNELGHLSPLDLQALASFRDDLPDDVIIYGINAACSANVRTWAYARSILNRYVSAGYKSVGDIKADEAKREAAKANGVSDGSGGRVQNPALNYQQRSNEDFDRPIENDWMKDFMPEASR